MHFKCAAVERGVERVPAVQVVLAAPYLRGTRVASIQQLLYDLIDVQDPTHEAVHLLVQTLKPEKGDVAQIGR